MSDEAHEILTLLETTETYLKTQAALYLPFGSVLQVGLDARTRADLILATVGYDELTVEAEEGTDELLRRATQTDEAAKPPPPEPALPPIEADRSPPKAVSAFDDEMVTVTDSEYSRRAAEDQFPPGFEPEPSDDLSTTPAHKAPAAAMEPLHEEGIGDRDETEDLLNEAGTIGAATGETRTEENTDPGIRVAEPGEDALVTIEDTSDPRSDLDDLSDIDFESLDGLDSDIDEDLGTAEAEVVVRKDDAASASKVEEIDIEELDEFDGEFEELGIEIDLDEDDANPIPDDEETFIADLADIEKMKAKMSGAGSPRKAGTPKVQVAGPRPAATPRVSVGGASAKQGGVTAGLYGNPSVPTIRDRNDPKPAAAAVQIGDAQEQAGLHAGGTGSLLEEEEVLELGSSEDYGEEEVDDEGGGGLSLDVQEYEEEDEYEEELEIEEDDLELQELEPDDVALEPIDDGPSEAELEALLKKAESAIEEGDMEAGINYYSDVLDSDPENVEAHVARGRLYLDYGDYSRAMSDFMYAESMEPENPEPQIAVGDLHFARKDYNRAIDYFNEALKMAPNHAMAFCRRGISHYYRKNYQQALDDLMRAQKIDDDIPNIRTYIAMAKKKTKR
jgi:tetratricopeptide (TPR) repeat protein